MTTTKEPDFEHLLEVAQGALTGALDALEHNDERGIIEFIRAAERQITAARAQLASLKVAG